MSKSSRNTRFTPGRSGNPAGRPKGARNKVTLAVEKLFADDAANIAKEAIKRAKEGDTAFVKLCLDRIAPPLRERRVCFDLPEMRNGDEAAAAASAIVQAAAAGELTPGEASELLRAIESATRIMLLPEMEARIARLEEGDT